MAAEVSRADLPDGRNCQFYLAEVQTQAAYDFAVVLAREQAYCGQNGLSTRERSPTK